MRPLGRRQISALLRLASPELVQIVPDRITRTLVKRGDVELLANNAWARITPQGLRSLADLLEQRKLDEFIPHELTPTIFTTAKSFFENHQRAAAKREAA